MPSVREKKEEGIVGRMGDSEDILDTFLAVNYFLEMILTL